jgi:carboxyl-terminal processing protease
MRMRLALAGTLLLATPLHAGDLTKVYPATLDYFEGQPTREWTCTKQDVWQLDSFHFEYQGKLEITLGKAVVVFGVAERNVVWAAVFPDKPGKIASRVGGDKEQATSIWMRFHPRHLGELFPAATVGKHGPEDQIAWGKRLCTWKISSGWQANNLPVIPKPGSIVLDCETVEGPRRYFVVEKEKGTVDLVAAFEKRALPALVPMEKAAAVRAFDTVWDAFDKEYAKFALVPKLDWKKAGEQCRKSAEKATTTFGAAAAIDALVSQLQDLHAWVQCGDEHLPGFTRARPLNASFKAVQNAFKDLTDTKRDFHWARTEDGIGYVLFYKLGDKANAAAFDEVLEQLGDCWGLVVDLRFNGGGNEDLAQEVAARFVDQERVYSTNQYRNGSKHDSLGPVLERKLRPRGPWRFESPVVCLQGQKTLSSAESMALMFAQCPQAITLGDRTGGSSGNPRLIELEGGIKVNLPRWHDMDPAGKPIEHVGIAPKVQLDVKPEEFTAVQDPVLEAALAHLRRQPESGREPGKR